MAVPLRCAFMGNRGILHRGTEIVSFHRGALWITCALEFRGWRAPQWQAGHYTPLFFHDEAVSLAAGHRPCALCRRAAYHGFREAASTGATPPSAKDLDRALHAERLVAGTHRRQLHPRAWSALPDGAFVLLDGRPSLVIGPVLIDWTVRGYIGTRPRPTLGAAAVITPPLALGALSAGYPVQIDGAATRFARQAAADSSSATEPAQADRTRRRRP